LDPGRRGISGASQLPPPKSIGGTSFRRTVSFPGCVFYIFYEKRREKAKKIVF
jgi:hypothetical protein